MAHEVLPPDPFADDPNDPARDVGEPDEPAEPISEEERAELLADLADLAVYENLLAPRGIRGVVVDCVECRDPHYHDWALLRASLEQLLHDGQMRPHEPAFDPDPASYVSWEYCKGFADACLTTQAGPPIAFGDGLGSS